MSGYKAITEDIFRKTIEDRLPDVFKRMDVPALLNNMISVQHLRNLEAKYGKPKSYLMGGRAYYRKEDFVEWAREHYNVRQAEESSDGI